MVTHVSARAFGGGEPLTPLPLRPVPLAAAMTPGPPGDLRDNAPPPAPQRDPPPRPARCASPQAPRAALRPLPGRRTAREQDAAHQDLAMQLAQISIGSKRAHEEI